MPRELTPDEVTEVIAVKDTDVNRKLILAWFSRRVEKTVDGKVVKNRPPRFDVEDILTIPAKTLANQPGVEKTTIGRYFFNMFILAGSFGEAIPFLDKRIDNKVEEALNNTIVGKMLEGSIKPEQMGMYHNRIHFLKPFTVLFMYGSSEKTTYASKAVQLRKKELIKENQELIDNNDILGYIEKVQKPLLKFAQAEMKEDQVGRMYDLKKPSVGNNFKNTVLEMGPMENHANGEFIISTNSLNDGIPNDKFAFYANQLIHGSYSRGVDTQVGGEMTKQLFSAFQTVKTKPNTDCKTKRVRKFLVDADNVNRLLFRYVIEKNKEPVLLTRDLLPQYIGKEILIRSPLYCESDDYCNICVGDLFRRINIDNIGLVVTRITNSIMSLALKSMHDATIKTTTIDPFKYITVTPKSA